MRRAVLGRPWLRLLVGAAVSSVALLLLFGPSDDAPDADPVREFPRRDGVESFRLVYRVEASEGSSTTTTWEERVVRRPFDGRLLGFAERPGARSQGTGTMTTAAGVFFVDEFGEATEAAGRVHAPPIGDFGYLTVLGELLEEGVVVDQESTRRVAGHRCRVYRTLEPPSLSLASPTRASYDELCVDASGVVLHEEWVVDGEVLLVREAVELDTAPPNELLRVFDAVAAAGESPPEPAELRGPHQGFLAPPPKPLGFRAVGRFEFAPDVRMTAPGSFYRSVYWVFVRRADYLVVEAGTGAPPFPVDGGRAIDVPGLGTGRLVVSEQGAEAGLVVGPSRWVRVRASAPMAWIEWYLTTLSVDT